MCNSKITFVAGARPNFMKIAPILRAMRPYSRVVKAEMVHTGQHYSPEMSDVFFEQLEMPAPDVFLGVGSGTHGWQTARLLESFEAHLLGSAQPPVCVVVVGDVNSTLACALAAAKICIPVVHVEAGLRSFDRTMPEELNRIATDAISDLLLVSEPSGKDNLIREGVSPHRMEYSGNVMIDTLVSQLPMATALDTPAMLGVADRAYALVTLHRPSNVDKLDSLLPLVAFLTKVARNVPLVFPVHPRTKLKLEMFGLWDTLRSEDNIKLCDPLGYRENLRMMSSACFVLSDSGGIQEETTFLGIPCLTLRPNTERPSTVVLGTNTVVGNDLGYAQRLIAEICCGTYKAGAAVPGWDGHAAERIANLIINRFVETAQNEFAAAEAAL